MTLSLRRKRQTTAPNTPAATDCKNRFAFAVSSSAALLAALVLLGNASSRADDFATATSRPVVKSNSKLRWLPYRPAKTKSEEAIRQVQYSTDLPADEWSSPDNKPTPAVRREADRTAPPDSIENAADEPKPAMPLAPPEELEKPLITTPTEPGTNGASDLPSDTMRNDSPGWNARSAPATRNSPGDYSSSDLFPLDTNQSEDKMSHCFSIKSLKPMSKITAEYAVVQGEMPKDCPWDNERNYAGRSWNPLTYTWTASALCHKPLYFEDEKLERYGHMWGPWLQPIISHGRFFATVPLLPYEMGLEPPHECIYVLGHYRPGSCAPYYLDPIPFSLRAALLQGGAVTGAIAIFP
jgi:hypothetical protein